MGPDSDNLDLTMAKADFRSDLQRIITNDLRTLGYVVEASDPLDSILMQYLNVSTRVPAVVTWRIEKSKELNNKALASPIRTGLENFTRSASTGDNLKPYLSKTIANSNYADRMFYDWGIFHFHLGDATDRARFCKTNGRITVCDKRPVV
jgi:hypothetical protein